MVDPRSGAPSLLARLLVDHPHQLAFCNALCVRVRVREAVVVVTGLIMVAIVNFTVVVVIAAF